ILFHMKTDKEYSFDDFVFITNRKLSRSVLSGFLNDAIRMSIIEKNKKKYRLTKTGIEIKNEFLKTKAMLLNNKGINYIECGSKSLINKERECLL
ncbi:hypothetical protein JXC34_00210, partial [Candidatus Woesearchaeota archaeon]|nr:hypothetical protein [Candidatus Woesearchaeota archaeon]